MRFVKQFVITHLGTRLVGRLPFVSPRQSLQRPLIFEVVGSQIIFGLLMTYLAPKDTFSANCVSWLEQDLRRGSSCYLRF